MLTEVLNKQKLNRDDLVYLLKLEDEKDTKQLFEFAYGIKEKYVDKKAYFRGLIEFSNQCVKDCSYCGIRRSNADVERFCMTIDDITQMARWAHNSGYGSVTIQAGERTDEGFINFASEAIRNIKQIGNGELGLTLSLGEQTEETYRKWFELGAHRYLLRIETTNKELYSKIHPNDDLHSFDKRVECLNNLKRAGFQVGTGVMIGLPWQTEEDLADDVLFFERLDVAMIGMGPYVVAKETPVGMYAIEQGLDTKTAKEKRLLLALKMIAVCRIYLKDVNIAASTALHALDPLGREKGLLAGANILMPIVSLTQHRRKYQLYDNKPFLTESPDAIKDGLIKRVETTGDTVGLNEWGDSRHFKQRARD